MKKRVNIHDAAEEVKAGKVLLYPTDTVWGIGCDASNVDAIKRIFEIKKRSTEKSFILLVNNVAMLERYVSQFPDVCYDLIDYAEEPLTIIYDQPINLPQELLAADGSIGIRVTNDLNCKKIIQRLRKPIVSTSANISGESNARNFSTISDEIKSAVDIILDDRINEEMGKPSSIIKVGSNNNVKIIR